MIGREGAASPDLHEIDILTKLEHMFESTAPPLRDELTDLDLLTWPEPPPDRTWADTAPSGIAALELDVDTADPAGLSDAQLIDAAVGFERQAPGAGAPPGPAPPRVPPPPPGGGQPPARSPPP